MILESGTSWITKLFPIFDNGNLIFYLPFEMWKLAQQMSTTYFEKIIRSKTHFRSDFIRKKFFKRAILS